MRYLDNGIEILPDEDKDRIAHCSCFIRWSLPSLLLWSAVCDQKRQCKKIKFASLQSRPGQELLEKYALPKSDFKTFVFLFHPVSTSRSLPGSCKSCDVSTDCGLLYMVWSWFRKCFVIGFMMASPRTAINYLVGIRPVLFPWRPATFWFGFWSQNQRAGRHLPSCLRWFAFCIFCRRYRFPL